MRCGLAVWSGGGVTTHMCTSCQVPTIAARSMWQLRERGERSDAKHLQAAHDGKTAHKLGYETKLYEVYMLGSRQPLSSRTAGCDRICMHRTNLATCYGPTQLCSFPASDAPSKRCRKTSVRQHHHSVCTAASPSCCECLDTLQRGRWLRWSTCLAPVQSVLSLGFQSQVKPQMCALPQFYQGLRRRRRR